MSCFHAASKAVMLFFFGCRRCILTLSDLNGFHNRSRSENTKTEKRIIPRLKWKSLDSDMIIPAIFTLLFWKCKQRLRRKRRDESWVTSIVHIGNRPSADVLPDFQVLNTNSQTLICCGAYCSLQPRAVIFMRRRRMRQRERKNKKPAEIMSLKLLFTETSTDSIDGKHGCSSQCRAHSHHHQPAPDERLLTANNKKERLLQQRASAKLRRLFGVEKFWGRSC